jgi:hypothetical protein
MCSVSPSITFSPSGFHEHKLILHDYLSKKEMFFCKKKEMNSE